MTDEQQAARPTMYVVLVMPADEDKRFHEVGRVVARGRRKAVEAALHNAEAEARQGEVYKAVPLSSWKSIKPKPPRQVLGGFEEVDG